jgi:hypothetical protein
LVDIKLLGSLRAQPNVLPDQPESFCAAGYGVKKLFRLEGLGQIVHGTGLNRFDRQFWRGVGGYHQNRQLWMRLPQPAQEVIAAHPIEVGVGNDHKERFATNQSEALFGAFDGLGGIAFVLQHRLEGETHVLLVIDDKDRWQSRSHGWKSTSVSNRASWEG